MTFKPMTVYKPDELTKDTPHIYYERVQQSEILEQLSKQIEEMLKPYQNRDDIVICIETGAEHYFEPGCLSIKVQILVKPKKEIKYEKERLCYEKISN